MSRHSKNNTASAVFTYYERTRLKHGTISERVSQDSLRHFDCCGLCLHPFIDPMCWCWCLFFLLFSLSFFIFFFCTFALSYFFSFSFQQEGTRVL
jgi:hypothetical protein